MEVNLQPLISGHDQANHEFMWMYTYFIFQDGSVRPLNVAVGERVLLPEFGGQKIKLGEDEFDLYRDAEFLGKFSSEE